MKVLKLINNERKQVFTNSRKACGYDKCWVSDIAFCHGTSDDVCKYDWAACGNGIDDTCKSNIIDKIGCVSELDRIYN